MIIDTRTTDRRISHAVKLVRERTVAVFDEGDHVRAITDDGTARFLLIAGQPINEPIVRRGPFVMNTKAEINQAILDYKSGALG